MEYGIERCYHTNCGRVHVPDIYIHVHAIVEFVQLPYSGFLTNSF